MEMFNKSKSLVPDSSRGTLRGLRRRLSGTRQSRINAYLGFKFRVDVHETPSPGFWDLLQVGDIVHTATDHDRHKYLCSEVPFPDIERLLRVDIEADIALFL